MIPKLICWLFGHIRRGQKNAHKIEGDQYGIYWDIFYYKYCPRCGEAL